MRQLLLYINFNGFQPTPCFSHVKKTHTFLYACIHIMLFIRILYTSQNLINFVITKFGGVWAASTLGAPARNSMQSNTQDWSFSTYNNFFSSGLGVSAIFYPPGPSYPGLGKVSIATTAKLYQPKPGQQSHYGQFARTRPGQQSDYGLVAPTYARST